MSTTRGWLMSEVYEQIEQHLPALQRYALSLTRNPTLAEELVQQCALRALEKREYFKEGTNLRAWLFTILHNLHISSGRSKSRWKEPVDSEEALATLSTLPQQHDSYFLKQVLEALTMLPVEQYTSLYLFAVEGLSYEEISERLNIFLGTVKSRCFRGREALQKILGNKLGGNYKLENREILSSLISLSECKPEKRKTHTVECFGIFFEVEVETSALFEGEIAETNVQVFRVS